MLQIYLQSQNYLYLIEADDPQENSDDLNSMLDDTLSSITDDIELRDYTDSAEMGESLPASSPFTLVNLRSGGFKTVRKSSLVWLLTKNRFYFSSDRLQRVKENDVIRFNIGNSVNSSSIDTDDESSISIQTEIYIGDWVVCVVNKKTVIGLVLSFVYLSGRNYRQREYTLNYAHIIANSDVGILCTWYECNDGILKNVVLDKNNYINIGNYKSTLLKAPTIINNQGHINVNAFRAVKNL